MLASPLPPHFLIHIVCRRHLCNTLCMDISFLLFWFICLCYSLVYFKKNPEYLTRSTAQVFIPLIMFLLDSFVLSSFLVSFSPSVRILSCFASSIPSVRCRLPLFIISMAHFSMLNSIPMPWLYIPTECIRVSNSFSFIANSLMYIRW